MKDQAGTEIVVGCRVAEVDFSYGDGIVESVTVPVVGGGINVGVKWDDPEKGGPEWSAGGGGRRQEPRSGTPLVRRAPLAGEGGDGGGGGG